MNGEWVPITEAEPKQDWCGTTIIMDADGGRNERQLRRRGSLWFTPDNAMYVYYQPTHFWRSKS